MEKLQITRSSPDHDELVELYKKEKNPKLKERYHALSLMRKFINCTIVAELIKRSRKTIQTWVKTFNNGGLEAIAPSSPPGRPSSLAEDLKLKDVVYKIVAEIKRVRQGKYSVSYADIVNYIQGHGEWGFDIHDERGLMRGEIIGNHIPPKFIDIVDEFYIPKYYFIKEKYII